MAMHDPKQPVLTGALAPAPIAAIVLLLGCVASLGIAGAPAHDRAALALATPQPKGQAPDDEDRAADRQAARQILQDNCLICHSEEMIAGQRLTAAQWKAEVEKMIGWGSPLPPEQAGPLTEFLTEQFNEKMPAPSSSRISYEDALAASGPEGRIEAVHGDVERGGKLYATHCATCHAADAQGADLGPNVVETAVLLRPTDFLAIVRDGKHRMPGFKLQLKTEQEKDLLSWLRSRHYQPLPAKAPVK